MENPIWPAGLPAGSPQRTLPSIKTNNRGIRAAWG